MRSFYQSFRIIGKCVTRGTLLVLLLVLVPVAIFPERTLPPLGPMLHHEIPIEKPEVLVVMLGDKSEIRVNAAAKYFRANGPINIMMLRGFQRRPRWSWTKPDSDQTIASGTEYRGKLVKLGIPEQNIHIVDDVRSFDTASESQILAGELRRRGIRRVLLVSSLGHTRRLAIVWDRVAPGFDRGILGAIDATSRDWWKSKRGRLAVAYEYGAFVKELVRRVWDLWSWQADDSSKG